MMKFKRLSSNSLVAYLRFEGDYVVFSTYHSWNTFYLPVLYTRRGTPYVVFEGEKWSLIDLFERSVILKGLLSD